MSKLTKDQLQVLQHTTGLNNGENRNHFCTGEGGKDFLICQSLVDAGLMTSRVEPLFGGDTLFHATAQGKQEAREKKQ
jgi:hypothetical protein